MHSLCFCYLFMTKRNKKLNLDLQEIWLISRNYQIFFRELSIYIESLQEVFASSCKGKKLLTNDVFFDDVVFIIAKILKGNLIKTETFSKEMATNQLNLIQLLEENFSQIPVFASCSFDYFIPIKNLLGLIINDDS